MFGFIVYMSVVLPGLRTVVTPSEGETEELTAGPSKKRAGNTTSTSSAYSDCLTICCLFPPFPSLPFLL